MERRTRNLVAVGVLTIIAAVTFYWLMLFLLGNSVFGSNVDLFVSLRDGGGIKRGDRVQIQGVEVGSVTEVDLDRRGGVLVEARLRDDLELPADTRATVVGDVFGAHTLQLIPGDATAPLAESDTIDGVSAQALTDVATSLGTRAEAVLAAADSLLSPAARADLQATAAALPVSIEALRAMIAEMKATAASLRSTIGQVEVERANALLADASGTLTEVGSSARALADAATAMQRSMDTLNDLLLRVQDGRGTLGLLMNDSTLYYTLQNSIREMGLLMADIRERPSRYITIRIF